MEGIWLAIVASRRQNAETKGGIENSVALRADSVWFSALISQRATVPTNNRYTRLFDHCCLERRVLTTISTVPVQ